MITALEKKLYKYIRKSSFYQTFQDYGKTGDRAPIYTEGLEGLVLAAFIKLSLESGKQKTWVVLPTEDEAASMMKNLTVLGCSLIRIENTGLKLYSDEVYDSSSYKRIKTFSEIQNLEKAVIITSLRAFSTPVPSPVFISDSKVQIRKGDTFRAVDFAEDLAAIGLIRVPATTMPGEFSVRGEVMDIYPFDSEYPIRIYIEWDIVEKISTYDPIGQETLTTLQEYSLYLQKETSGNKEEQHCAINSYISQDDLVVLIGEQRLEASYESITLEAKKMFREAFRHDRNSKRPDEILFPYTFYIENHVNTVVVEDLRGQKNGSFCHNIMGARSYFGNFNYFRDELQVLKRDGYSITIFSGTNNQAQRLQLMLKDDQVSIIPLEISEGFSIPEEQIIVICDHEIFGRRKKSLKALHHTNVSPLDTFVDLEPGDYVVHINYGIGKFKKIDRLKALGKERDYIQIEYSDNEDIFIPIEQANLVQRYIGKDGSAPRLDTLGGTSWEAKKKKAKKSAEDLAERLIHLYARRKQAKGTAFPKDTDWQLQFEAMFQYDETEDQISCIQDVKSDMEQPILMDRLICGDVGYGKTEVAIRAAFKAVMAGKQVALLAPTTILAEQHYDTISERIGSFPMRVGMLSRLVKKKDQKKTLVKLAEGQVDILIGTHRIIQKDIVYKDLGLLIIDEEQRFGVKDKEKIKEIKTSIDSLALSATPIPRTLYMSLLKIRDMSLLATPPIQRRAIKTIIQEYEEDEVRKAILRETKRGGQVFYLHNRIETLDRVVSMLKDIVPEVSIDFAHGQMDPETLEDKMRVFVHNGYQVLVATTIIENGIDIPNVNTIIIDRADRYGVSQLYQLRGRVGRSDREAYAYLFYPNQKALSEIAMKRLKILSEHTELGSGFKIAMKDMEMRGTGNLLGREQSGQMQAVGLDMYLRILDETISKMTDSEKSIDEDVFLDLDYSGFIPDTYILDPGTKFKIYRKIAVIQKEIELKQLTSELEDRFGPIPDDVLNLLFIAEIKVLCKKLAIYQLRESKGTVRVEFSRVANIAIDRLIDMIRESSGALSIDQKHPNILTMKTDAVSLKDKSLFILEKLQRLL